ncbi:MAG: hypothetical protein EXR00_08570 [Alphaproteobacteria bacterium]|nr:hypothetical protein [Alphaproteobacteria bacterium]
MKLIDQGNDRWLLEVQFDIPEGKRVELARQDVALITDANDAPRRINYSGMGLTGNPALPLVAIAPMVGGYNLGNPAFVKHYWLYAPVDAAGADSLRIALSPFAINDRMQTLPEIRFSRVTDVQLVAPIQC